MMGCHTETLLILFPNKVFCKFHFEHTTLDLMPNKCQHQGFGINRDVNEHHEESCSLLSWLMHWLVRVMLSLVWPLVTILRSRILVHDQREFLGIHANTGMGSWDGSCVDGKDGIMYKTLSGCWGSGFEPFETSSLLSFFPRLEPTDTLSMHPPGFKVINPHLLQHAGPLTDVTSRASFDVTFRPRVSECVELCSHLHWVVACPSIPSTSCDRGTENHGFQYLVFVIVGFLAYRSGSHGALLGEPTRWSLLSFPFNIHHAVLNTSHTLCTVKPPDQSISHTPVVFSAFQIFYSLPPPRNSHFLSSLAYDHRLIYPCPLGRITFSEGPSILRPLSV